MTDSQRRALSIVSLLLSIAFALYVAYEVGYTAGSDDRDRDKYKDFMQGYMQAVRDGEAAETVVDRLCPRRPAALP